MISFFKKKKKRIIALPPDSDSHLLPQKEQYDSVCEAEACMSAPGLHFFGANRADPTLSEGIILVAKQLSRQEQALGKPLLGQL